MTSAASAGRLFVLGGIDGAGKTTLLRRVASLRPEWAVGSYHPRDWLPHPDLQHFDWCLQRHPKTAVARAAPRVRAAFLVSMVLSHFESWLRPRLEAGRVVLLDSYHFRFQAREAARGSLPEFMVRAFAELPAADAVILAELSPRAAASRKTEFDPHECFERTDAEDFIRFQSAVLVELERLARAGSREVVRLNAALPAATVADQLIDVVEARCRS